MPQRLELAAEHLVIVDLAIVGDPNAAIAVGHGLGAPFEIDHLEASMPEGDSGLLVIALGIRAAMGERLGHCADDVRVDRRCGFRAGRCGYDSCDSAHSLQPGGGKGSRLFVRGVFARPVADVEHPRHAPVLVALPDHCHRVGIVDSNAFVAEREVKI